MLMDLERLPMLAVGTADLAPLLPLDLRRIGNWRKKCISRPLLRVSACAGSPVLQQHGTGLQLLHSCPSFDARKPVTKVEPIRTLLLDNYDSYTYNLFQLLSVINGVAPVVIKNDEMDWNELKHLLYEVRAFHNVVISPGPGSPQCASDIGVCIQLLKECSDIPILGVCMGHQALGFAHGARVVHAPEPVHGRLSEIDHDGSLLFKDIPSGLGSGFKVVRYHSLMIDPTSLPDDLVPTAWTVLSDSLSSLDLSESVSSCATTSGFTDHRGTIGRGSHVSGRKGAIEQVNGTIGRHNMDRQSSDIAGTAQTDTRVLMGVSHRSWPHHGVQFHPESVATAHGRQILQNFGDITREFWQHQAWQPYSLAYPPQPYVSSVYPGITSAVKCRSDEPTVNLLKEGSFTRNGHSSVQSTELRVFWRKIAGMASEVGGSESIFCELFGSGAAQNTFWLDSSCRDQGRARFSFMGGKGGPLWKQFTYKLSEVMQTTGTLIVEDVVGNVTEEKLDQGFFDFLEKTLQNYSCRKEDLENLPFDFCGGFIGYLGYELKVECGAKINLHSSPHPDAGFFLADRLIVVDHACDDIYVLGVSDNTVTCPGGKGRRTNGSSSACGAQQLAEEWVHQTSEKILLLRQRTVTSAAMRKVLSLSLTRSHPESTSSEFQIQTSRSSYIRDVESCLSYIKDGESYEVCLTTQLKAIAKSVDGLGLYLTLREMNPAPYAAWLHFGERGPRICCSSPERFLRLDQTGTLEAKPIKGTMPRGVSQAEDDDLRCQLLNSEKDLAENLMIVDLLRNDLGIVCEAGSVHVPSLMTVESYSTVHTLVSTVRGTKRSDTTPIACIRAAFPGGSMTGAPKLRTMEILDSIESSARGVYSGSIGFLSFNSSFDLNIVIRTLVLNDDEACIGAGGAVVALSDPQAEYEEMLLKTRAPIKAFSEFDVESKITK